MRALWPLINPRRFGVSSMPSGEPIGSFSIYLDLLERERQTAGAQAYLKAMRASMKRAVDVFDEIDFWLDNGYPRPVAPRDLAPKGPRPARSEGASRSWSGARVRTTRDLSARVSQFPYVAVDQPVEAPPPCAERPVIEQHGENQHNEE